LENGDNVSTIILLDAFFNYKKAVSNIHNEINEKNNSNQISYDINYKYDPIIKPKLYKYKIVLFKTQQFIKDSLEQGDPSNLDNENKRYQYYTYNTFYNHLNDILSINKFKVIKMEPTHSSWVNNSKEILKICNKLT